MSNSPCGGCPPCCTRCVFSAKGNEAPHSSFVEVISAENYGCVKGSYAVGRKDGELGQMRDGAFHPVTKTGAAFLNKSGNPLAQHIG
jgi:hypothetical protein